MISALILPAIASLATGWTFVDSPPGELYSTVQSIGDRLISVQYGLPRISDDDGQTWRTSAQGMPTNAICAQGDEENGILVAYCSGKFYRSSDRGDSWSDWSQGFEVDPLISPHINLAVGDSSVVFLAGFEEEAKLWVRQGNAPWKRVQHGRYLAPQLEWTGGTYLMKGETPDYKSTLVRSVDGATWSSRSVGRWLQSVASRNDTTWMLVDDTLHTSLDHGATWLPNKLPIPAWQISATKRGFYGVRNDSIRSIDPRTGTSKLIAVNKDLWPSLAFSSGSSEFLPTSGGQALVSDDAGLTWKTRSLPATSQYSGAITRHGNSWLVDGDGSLWSRKEGGSWNLNDSVYASSFRSFEGTLYAGGYYLNALRNGVWKREGFARPNDEYSEGQFRWLEGLDLPAVTDGDHVWVRDPETAVWFPLEAQIGLGSNANTAVGFASRIWFAKHTYRQYIEDCLVSFDLSTGMRQPHQLPHIEGAYRIGASRRTLWVASDLGLMRSDDTGKSFREAGLPSPWNERAVSELLVHGDTIAATFLTVAVRHADSPDRGTWISFDNGANWTRDADTSFVASAFFADSTGLYAFMFGAGIHRWSASSATRSKAPQAPSRAPISLRGSGGSWTVSGEPGDAIEIRDTLGKLIATTTLDAQGFSVALAMSTGVHHLTATSRSGSRSTSVVVP